MEEIKHAHAVIDQDLPFVIDPITKEVTSQGGSLVVPQHAKNAERFTFTIPDRYIEGHDMSEVNQAFVHFRNVGTQGQLSAGIYKVEDLAVADDSVTLSWLIDDDATYYVGALIFSIHFICTDESGKVIYDLPTLAYSKISVGETVWNSETIAKQYPDIIAQLEARVSAIEAGGAPGGTGFPVAYLYNGVELPPLPQWDKEEFPYAFISENIPYGQYDGYAYRLHLYAAPCYVAYDENGKVNRVFTEKNSPYQLWGGNTGAVAWDFSGDGNNLTGSVTNNLPLWVNADMYYNGNDPANSLYMSQSNPVPVYPESGGSAADAVLFTPQTLTEEQKAQARENIGIVGTGVCLPAVELEADFAEDTALSAEDSAKMDSVALMGMPVVVRFPVVEEMCCAVFSALSDGAAFCASLNGAHILIAKSDSGWAVEIRIGL